MTVIDLFKTFIQLFSYPGTGAKFTSSFTGKVEKIIFEFDGVIFEFYYFDINGGYGTYSMQGSGMVSNPGGIVQSNFLLTNNSRKQQIDHFYTARIFPLFEIQNYLAKLPHVANTPASRHHVHRYRWLYGPDG